MIKIRTWLIIYQCQKVDENNHKQINPDNVTSSIISISDLSDRDFLINQCEIRPDVAEKLRLTINSLKQELVNKDHEIAELKERLQEKEEQEERDNFIDQVVDDTDNYHLNRSSPSLSLTPPSSYAQITPTYQTRSDHNDNNNDNNNNSHNNNNDPPHPDSVETSNNGNSNNDVVSFSMNAFMTDILFSPPNNNTRQNKDKYKKKRKNKRN